MTDMLIIDGSYGEGGGQILRSAVKLAAMSGRTIRIERIRAGRRNPGLAAQHLTAIRAAAALCDARLDGDELESETLTFSPTREVRAGCYAFDVADARPGGSAGSACLVLQTVLMPLALVTGKSEISIRGGTHVAWSPSFDYLKDVWMPALRSLGVQAEVAMEASGWFPVGQGHIEARIQGRRHPPLPGDLRERGELLGISGRAIAANLPAHIPQRMADRARALLSDLQVPVHVRPLRLRADCPGAGLFLTFRYENVACGFSALGSRGKSSEQVAEEAVELAMSHYGSDAALDEHLADQILLPLSVAGGISYFTVERVSLHLETNAWLIERFGTANVAVGRRQDGTGHVAVVPAAVAAAVTEA